MVTSLHHLSVLIVLMIQVHETCTFNKREEPNHILLADRTSLQRLNGLTSLQKISSAKDFNQINILQFTGYHDRVKKTLHFKVCNATITTGSEQNNQSWIKHKNRRLPYASWYLFWIVHYLLPVLTFIIGRRSMKNFVTSSLEPEESPSELCLDENQAREASNQALDGKVDSNTLTLVNSVIATEIKGNAESENTAKGEEDSNAKTINVIQEGLDEALAEGYSSMSIVTNNDCQIDSVHFANIVMVSSEKATTEANDAKLSSSQQISLSASNENQNLSKNANLKSLDDTSNVLNTTPVDRFTHGFKRQRLQKSNSYPQLSILEDGSFNTCYKQIRSDRWKGLFDPLCKIIDTPSMRSYRSNISGTTLRLTRSVPLASLSDCCPDLPLKIIDLNFENPKIHCKETEETKDHSVVHIYNFEDSLSRIKMEKVPKWANDTSDASVTNLRCINHPSSTSTIEEEVIAVFDAINSSKVHTDFTAVGVNQNLLNQNKSTTMESLGGNHPEWASSNEEPTNIDDLAQEDVGELLRSGEIATVIRGKTSKFEDSAVFDLNGKSEKNLEYGKIESKRTAGADLGAYCADSVNYHLNASSDVTSALQRDREGESASTLAKESSGCVLTTSGMIDSEREQTFKSAPLCSREGSSFSDLCANCIKELGLTKHASISCDSGRDNSQKTSPSDGFSTTGSQRDSFYTHCEQEKESSRRCCKRCKAPIPKVGATSSSSETTHRPHKGTEALKENCLESIDISDKNPGNLEFDPSGCTKNVEFNQTEYTEANLQKHSEKVVGQSDSLQTSERGNMPCIVGEKDGVTAGAHASDNPLPTVQNITTSFPPLADNDRQTTKCATEGTASSSPMKQCDGQQHINKHSHSVQYPQVHESNRGPANQTSPCVDHKSDNVHDICSSLGLPNNTCIYIPCAKFIKSKPGYQSIETTCGRIIRVSNARVLRNGKSSKTKETKVLKHVSSRAHRCNQSQSQRRELWINNELVIDIRRQNNIHLAGEGKHATVDIWSLYPKPDTSSSVDSASLRKSKVILSKEALVLISNLTKYAVAKGCQARFSSEID